MSGNSDTSQVLEDLATPHHENMVKIPSGTFRMGSDDFYPEERPA